jgi:hypothetical protein
MSNALAIATITATLRNLLMHGVTLDQDLADATVTMQPPDRARQNGSNANQLNLFLYQATPNAAWRNMDNPRRVHAGETAVPPLALNLYYLVTAYGRDNDAQRPFSHQLLGRAMSILQDHPLLGPDELKGALAGSDVHTQVERVRFTLQPLTLEEIVKLWSGFQTHYRLSVAYEASVVLIDSALPSRSPLPVLTRARDDAGISAQADLVPPFPTIEEVLITPAGGDDKKMIPNKETSGQLGDVVTIIGHHLAADEVRVLFRLRGLPQPIPMRPAAGQTAERIKVTIEDVPTRWVPGLYTLTVELTSKPGTPEAQVRSSNDAPLALAAKILTPFPISVARGADGAVTLSLTISPRVGPDNAVALLLGDREVPAEPRSTAGDHVTFHIRQAPIGRFLIRLRVDGVDSVLIDRTGARPVFKDHVVTIT